MDPRRLLGVGARAGRAEVRSAHRRLRRAVDPVAGGTAELARLVDTAGAVLTGGASIDTLPTRPEPAAVLGVRRGADTDEVHEAYRRLARIVHPDRGGTDELFRVVAAAQESLLHPTAPWSGARRPKPPPPPPPRGPYKAPPPEERHVVSTWQAVRDLAFHLSVFALVGVVIVGAFALHPFLGLLATILAVAWGGGALRSSGQAVLRAAIVLLGSRVTVDDDVAPERFLEERCLDAPIGRQGERSLYDAYVRWCADRRPVAPWVFVERLRTLGLLLVKTSAWEEGLWVGVTIRR